MTMTLMKRIFFPLIYPYFSTPLLRSFPRCLAFEINTTSRLVRLIRLPTCILAVCFLFSLYLSFSSLELTPFSPSRLRVYVIVARKKSGFIRKIFLR